ncbi:acyltransferase family protein [Sphingomonas sp. SFZ2018-12]|uniref:acyltransferase family protein n=1 Tax=Sphingomonas sp. SFZ2018-12 TaxID=2683197 RepID=UPI001F0CFA78|nr:acyltransferase [Sphingomonas sp. SFZ2018-12]MCH4893666.1 acyltransferase family protein [Sphingomonas sp. SFZ2018-12]
MRDTNMDEHAGTGANADRYYRPELDALRFFAFLLTFVWHRMAHLPTDRVADAWAWRLGTIGAFGLPVFFLLSAFLITELLLRERDRMGGVDIGAFYIRRILRIWPLYFAAFYFLVILDFAVPGVGTRDPLAWLAFSLFAGNWYVTIQGWIAAPIDPLWSISVEEQFYLVIPVLIAKGGRRALMAAAVLMLIGAYVTIGIYAWRPLPGDQGQWTNSFFQFQFFAAGVVLAVRLRGQLPRLAAWMRRGAFILGFACWLVAVAVFDVRSWDPQPSFAGAFAGWLLVLVGTLLFFCGTLGIDAQAVPKWLTYLGRISFGLYVIHSLLFVLIFDKALPWLALSTRSLPVNAGATAAVLLLSIGAAHLSFRYFERPIIRLKSRFTYVRAREDA